MKSRKKYTITILPFRMVAVLTKHKHWWTKWMERNATVGCAIYDCTFNEAVYNLKILSNRGYYISKRRRKTKSYNRAI